MKLNKILIPGLLLMLLTVTLAACGDNAATTGPAAAPTTAAMTTAVMTTAAMTSMPAMTTAVMTTPAATTAAMPSMAVMTTPAATTMAPVTGMAAMTTPAAMTTGAAGATQAMSGKTMEISISDFSFSPDTLTIPVGTKVIWTNKDSVGHTVTSDDTGGLLKSSLIEQNKTYEYTFDKAGTYAYHCEPHPFMKARIIVQP